MQVRYIAALAWMRS